MSGESSSSSGQTSTASVVVVCEGTMPAACKDAQATAAEFGLAYGETDEGYDFALARDNERWALRDAREPRMQPIVVDFAELARRLRGNIGKRQPLARAVGARVKTVIDATTGLGQDAFTLALMGFQVTSIERSPVIAVLVRDGLRRARLDPALTNATQRLQFVFGDARMLLRTLGPADTIYIDPMFPPKRKASAAVRKEMRWLRAVAGEDVDAGELFGIAMDAARERVVVKRPDDADPLRGQPDVSYGGKMVRYDVHHARKRVKEANV